MRLDEILNDVIVIDRPPAGVKSPKEVPDNEPGAKRVMILNDPITPAEVVVEAVMSAVGLSKPAAMKRMLRAHRRGYVHVATYSNQDIAETVAHNIMKHAQANTRYDSYRSILNYFAPWPLAAEVLDADE